MCESPQSDQSEIDIERPTRINNSHTDQFAENRIDEVLNALFVELMSDLVHTKTDSNLSQTSTPPSFSKTKDN